MNGSSKRVLYEFGKKILVSVVLSEINPCLNCASVVPIDYIRAWLVTIDRMGSGALVDRTCVRSSGTLLHRCLSRCGLWLIIVSCIQVIGVFCYFQISDFSFAFIFCCYVYKMNQWWCFFSLCLLHSFLRTCILLLVWPMYFLKILT